MGQVAMPMPDHRDNEGNNHEFWESCVKLWENLGDAMKSRPLMIVGMLVGAMIFASTLGYATATSYKNAQDIDAVRAAFCDTERSLADKRNSEQCGDLLTRLIRDPTPEQAKRLREIVEKGR